MAGYVGRGQPVAVEDNSVETADIIDGAVTDAKLNSTKLNAIESGATADQTKADIDALGINAAKVNSKTVLTNVPTGAVFTDTVYSKPSAEPISYITGLQTAINAKVSSETGKSLITDTVLATLLSDVGALESLVTSDESTLDTLQEIVDFIEANKSTLDALGISSIAGLSSALAGKVDDSQVLTNVPTGALFTDTDTNTTYSVGDGGLTQKNFTTTLKSKLDGVASSANNYTHPSAHSISEVTNLQTELDDIETLALAGL